MMLFVIHLVCCCFLCKSERVFFDWRMLRVEDASGGADCCLFSVNYCFCIFGSLFYFIVKE